MKNKIFYGWYIVGAGIIMASLNSIIFGYGWTAFVNPILATFGWSMTQFSFGSSLRSLEQGVFNPVWGRAVDRWSARKLMAVGVAMTALSVFCLSQTRNLAMYYAGFAIAGLATSLVGGMLPQTLIARWFKKDMGKAAGLFAIGSGIGGVMVPLVTKLVDSLGWQNTLLFISIAFLVLGIPISFIMRNRPQDYGMVPDGKESNDNGSNRRRAGDFSTGVKEAVKMRAFWHQAVVVFYHHVVVATIQVYAMPYLSGLGMSRTSASMVIMLYTAISLPIRPFMGMLSDRFKTSHVIGLATAMQTGGMFAFWLLTGRSPFWMILLFALSYGIGVGGNATLRGPLVAEYFGTRNFGAIFGLTSLFVTVAQVGSQVLVARIYDIYHDYRIWWLVTVGLGLLALIAILTIPAPRRTAQQKSA